MSIHLKFSLMNHIVDRSRDGEVSNFFPGLWEKPSSSSPSLLCLGETSPVRFQSATISAKHTTQTLHWQDKGSRIEGQSLLGERLFQKEECEIVWESCFSSLNVPFRKFDKPGPGLSNFLVTRPDFSFSYTWQAKLDFLSFSLFNLYMSMRMEAHWASPLPALAHQ